MDPESLRADIPALEDCIYLNTGASSPSPRHVVDAVTEFQESQQFDAPCGEGVYNIFMDARVDTRRAIADHVGGVAREGIRTLCNERYYQIIYRLTIIGYW